MGTAWTPLPGEGDNGMGGHGGPWLPGVRGVRACSEAAAKPCQQSSTFRLYLLKVCSKMLLPGFRGPYLMG